MDTTSRESVLSVLGDQDWRLEHLYKIKDKEGRMVNFKLNWAQKLLRKPHYFNIILKARQLGITTYHALLFLDTCLFNSNVNAAIIADSRNVAREIFVDKVKFAYDHLPEFVKDMCPAHRDNVHEMRFANGSVFRVATTLRGGTIQLLHISEFAKICQENPHKANEIVSGAINAVQSGQFICIESTARGRHGHFYNLCKSAQALKDSGAELGKLDWKLVFLPWHESVEYSLDSRNVLITKDMMSYFNDLASKGISLTPDQKAWYVKKTETQGEYMKREYPSCIAVDTPILTHQGIYKIQDVLVDGEIILDKFYKGKQPVYEVITKLGYSLKCTLDHKILSNNEFKRLQDLVIGDSIHLDYGAFPKEILSVEYFLEPFVKSSVNITPDIARFIGYFMGDGSFYKDCIEFACDKQDEDVIEDIRSLIEQITGKTVHDKVCGSKLGCVTLRTSNISYKNHFYKLDLIRQNSSLSFKRNINVPWYIKQSPRDVVKQFLIGLFEADGFAQRNGSGVKFFSKYLEFIRDVQLLLLQFGITSRLSSHNKKSGCGNIYTGFELCLRKQECARFIQEIGFFSKRKNDRLAQFSDKPHYNTCQLNFLDDIVRIDLIDELDVWDLTTSTKQYSAGGIIVHNCPDEAFESANEGFYFAKQIAQARQERRICHLPYDDHAKTYTSWDIGISDSCAIWVWQLVGKEIHCIDHYENSDEPLAHYVQWLNKLPYTYEKHFLPHDAAARSAQSGKSFADIARERGLKVEIVPRQQNELFGIECLRNALPKFFFDYVKCEKGLKALENFRKEWNEKLGCYRERSYHDWASHSSKALIYGAEALVRLSGGNGMSAEQWRKMRQEWI